MDVRCKRALITQTSIRVLHGSYEDSAHHLSLFLLVTQARPAMTQSSHSMCLQFVVVAFVPRRHRHLGLLKVVNLMR